MLRGKGKLKGGVKKWLHVYENDVDRFVCGSKLMVRATAHMVRLYIEEHITYHVNVHINMLRSGAHITRHLLLALTTSDVKLRRVASPILILHVSTVVAVYMLSCAHISLGLPWNIQVIWIRY